jgi:hypothetical protein
MREACVLGKGFVTGCDRWADHLSTHGTREGIYKRILDEVNGTVCTMKYTVRQAQFLSEPARCEGSV